MSTALTLVEPLPGLAPAVDYLLSEIEQAPGLFSLESSSPAGIRLHVISAAAYLPGYAPALPAEGVDGLGTHPELLIVTTLEDGTPWVNLLAPIVVDPDTGAARQVILEGDYPVRVALTEVAAAA
jgi:flagellar assembly factor FliW